MRMEVPYSALFTSLPESLARCSFRRASATCARAAPRLRSSSGSLGISLFRFMGLGLPFRLFDLELGVFRRSDISLADTGDGCHRALYAPSSSLLKAMSFISRWSESKSLSS